MEGEALASRLLELQPQGAKFLAPVIIEVPIFTAPSPDREIVILRSDTGETWQDHYLHNSDNPLIQEALAKEKLEGEAVGEGGARVWRVVTCDFPHYVAAVSRVRQQVHAVGAEGGAVHSSSVPQVQALFPPNALTKRIRVGLQAHCAGAAGARLLPRSAAASPVLTVEPRRRKFHRSITLTVPLPRDQTTNQPTSQNLRLLCSIMGGAARAVWEDVTGSTPLTIAGDCASFTTTVSARFWLMSCQNVSEATKLATELYREMLLVPFNVRLVVLGKRLDSAEGRLLVLYITDRYAYDTLLQQEHYTEVAHSTAVRLLDGKSVFLEFSGNLLPVTKCASQPSFTFEAFKDNRVEFPVRLKHQGEPAEGRIYFMNEPKAAKGEPSPAPACVLDVALPAQSAPRAARSHHDCLNLDQSGFDALNDELSSSQWEHNGPATLPRANGHANGHESPITNGKHTERDTDAKDTPLPQANGNTVHVDSNKAKATFDSDEDKTPHNTLEKGKKKDGFLGGLADKVKNVFTHDEDDKKESSPKPKPREEKKEKSPPKPAPRIIKEDLLDKVEDMFKDLQTKPPREEEVYQTKLVVDEEEKLNPEDMYANKEPIDTPVCNKKSDPFIYPKCCDGGPKHKHTHEETTNLVDMIEQETFSQKEKLQELEDRVASEIENGKDKLEKEKQNIQQKSNAVIEDIKEKSEKVKQDLEKEGHGLLSDAQKGFDHMSFIANEQTHTAAHLAQDAQDKVADAQASAKDTVDHAKSIAEETQENIKEQAQKLNNKAHDVASNLKSEAQLAGDSIKNKATELQDDAKSGLNKAKDAANEKLNQASDSLEDAKKKAQDAKEDIQKDVQKKKKKGKNFIGGLVSNIFGEKEKIEKEVEGKIAEGKNKANELAQQAEAKKEEIVQKVESTKDDVVQKAAAKKDDVAHQVESAKDNLVHQAEVTKDNLVHQVETTKDSVVHEAEAAKHDLVEKANAKKVQIQDAVTNKQEELRQDIDQLAQSAHDKKDEIVTEIQNKTAEAANQVQSQFHDISDDLKARKEEVETEAQAHVDTIIKQAEQTTEDIKKSAESALNAVADKRQDIQAKAGDLQQSVRDDLGHLQDAASERIDDLSKSAKDSYEHYQDSASGAFDRFEGATKDALKSAHENLDDLQSSTRDTFANLHDDVLENSQDTLHSFQSSAGNTFDSLEDSAREYVGHTADASKELFGEAKEEFEGFKVSADNKLEDVKWDVKERLEGAGGEAAREADAFTSNLNNIGSEVFGISGKGFMKDTSSKLLESEKAASSPHKKASGIPKLKKKKK